MRHPYIQYFKQRIFLVLAVIIATILLNGLFFSMYLEQIDRSIETMYSDRLVPASELFHLSDLMYERLDAVEEGNMQVIKNLRTQMDSIHNAYENTYLVNQEVNHLKAYRLAVQEYTDNETTVLAGGDAPYRLAHRAVQKELITLSDIQLDVGKEIWSSQRQLHSSMSLSKQLENSLLVGVVMLLILLVYDHRSHLPKIRQPYFRSN